MCFHLSSDVINQPLCLSSWQEGYSRRECIHPTGETNYLSGITLKMDKSWKESILISWSYWRNFFTVPVKVCLGFWQWFLSWHLTFTGQWLIADTKSVLVKHGDAMHAIEREDYKWEQFRARPMSKCKGSGDRKDLVDELKYPQRVDLCVKGDKDWRTSQMDRSWSK